MKMRHKRRLHRRWDQVRSVFKERLKDVPKNKRHYAIAKASGLRQAIYDMFELTGKSKQTLKRFNKYRKRAVAQKIIKGNTP